MHDSWKKLNSTPPVILFATPPPLEALRALTVRIDNQVQSYQFQPLAKFQPQVIKCREFIFTEPEVIGTPSLELKDCCFHLVAQIPLIQSGKLQKRLSRVGLQVTKPYHVTPELYQSCLRYTMMARISPSWNKAGEWLLQGRDFLTHTGAVNAVKMDLSVNCDELYFTLEATALKFFPLKVTDLDILGDRMEQFLKHQISEIVRDSIASDWCFVLPSMKKGRIMSISHEIPEDSPFMSYRDLKRFWKNIYGYRLPESDEDMIYYQINFGPLGGRLFTYPEVCLRAREIQPVTRVDPKPILRAFMQEIKAKFPTICGAPMQLQSKAKFPISQLFESGQNEPQNQPNLTNKLPSRPTAYRTSEEMERLLSTRRPAASQMNAWSQNTNTPRTVQISSATQNTTSSNQTGQNRLAQQTCKDKQSEIPKHTSSGSSNDVVHTLTYTNRLVAVESGNSLRKSPATPSKTITQTKPHYEKLHTGSVYSSCSSEKFSSSSSFKNNHIANQQTPSQVQSALNQANTTLSQTSVARKLFPLFKSKQVNSQIVSSQTVNTEDSKVSKIKPTFSIQKKPSIPASRESSIIQGTREMSVTTDFSSTATLNSQPSQTLVRKVPLFFKKSIGTGQDVVLGKKVQVNKKAAGGKKAKPNAVSSTGAKEKITKRNIKMDGEVKKKRLKQSVQKPEQ